MQNGSVLKDTAVIINSLDNKGDERLLAHYFNEGTTVESYVVITENRYPGTSLLPSAAYSTRQEALGNLSAIAFTYYTSIENAISGVGKTLTLRRTRMVRQRIARIFGRLRRRKFPTFFRIITVTADGTVTLTPIAS